MGSGKVLLGVLAGVAVGATLGILFAPDKGSETRKKISQTARHFLLNCINYFGFNELIVLMNSFVKCLIISLL